MSNSQLVGTIWNTDFQAPHYFDGRLLFAEDLKAEQKTVLTHQSWLGKSAGYGVIEGLVVSQINNVTIHIAPGLGLNREGQVISLSAPFTLPLTLQVTGTVPIDDAGRFASCEVPVSTGTGVVPAGTYLLTAIPASRLQGQVPMKTATNGVTTSTAATGSRWEVEGVQFKVIPIPLTLEPDGTPIVDEHRRNLVAHWCYGTILLQTMGLDPFDFPNLYTNLDLQTPAILQDFTACDLPLAVFYWDGSALGFVDIWSARRRVIHPDALAGTQPTAFTGTWSAIVSDRHEGQNQARFLQFQDQLASLVARAHATGGSHLNLSQVQATDFFHFLPPAGFLPITPGSMSDLLCIDYDTGLAAEARKIFTAATQWMGGLASIPRSILSFLHLGVSTHPQFQDMQSQVASLQRQLSDMQSRLDAVAAPVGDLPVRVAELEQQIEALGATPRGEATAGGTAPSTTSSTTQEARINLEKSLQQRVCDILHDRSGSGTNGFDLGQFFTGIPLRINLISSDSIDLLLHRSWYEEAIELVALQQQVSAGDGDSQLPHFPLIDIYLVEENLLDQGPDWQLYVIFHKATHTFVLRDPYQDHNVQHIPPEQGTTGGVQLQ